MDDTAEEAESQREAVLSLLVKKSSTVANRSKVLLVPHRCKCQFCPDCRTSAMIKWREALRPALEGWKAAYMITLTVDPKLFPGGPEAAYDEIRTRRWIAETIRKLKRKGFLLSERWFYAMEFHANGWPHWHVAVESEFVPFDLLKETWGYGGVRFSKQKSFQNPGHAINYLTKYVSTPEHGTPDWVLSSNTRIRLISTSRGLLPSKRKRSTEGTSTKVRISKPIGQRIAKCKNHTKIVEKVPVQGGFGYRYIDSIGIPWKDEFSELYLEAFLLRQELSEGDEVPGVVLWSGVPAGADPETTPEGLQVGPLDTTVDSPTRRKKAA